MIGGIWWKLSDWELAQGINAQSSGFANMEFVAECERHERQSTIVALLLVQPLLVSLLAYHLSEPSLADISPNTSFSKPF